MIFTWRSSLHGNVCVLRERHVLKKLWWENFINSVLIKFNIVLNKISPCFLRAVSYQSYKVPLALSKTKGDLTLCLWFNSLSGKFKIVWLYKSKFFFILNVRFLCSNIVFHVVDDFLTLFCWLFLIINYYKNVYFDIPINSPIAWNNNIRQLKLVEGILEQYCTSLTHTCMHALTQNETTSGRHMKFYLKIITSKIWS